MAKTPSHMDDPSNLLRVLPVEILEDRKFLLWKEVPNPRVPGKTRKLPYYADGRPRKNLLDTQADLDRLVSFDEAFDAYLLGDYAGIGYALTGSGVAAFDFDYILDEAKELLDIHPGTPIVRALEKAGAYLEVSPSGRGIRAVGPCTNFPAYSVNQVEWWSSGRFVTLSGNVWKNPRGWIDLEPFIRPLIQERDGNKPKRDEDHRDLQDGIVTPETIEELRDALTHIDAGEYETWIGVGQALSTLPENKGQELWTAWSKTSDKYQKGDEARWDTFTGERTGWRSVFARAQREGWTNPARGRASLSRFAEADEDDEDDGDNPRSSRRAFLDMEEQKLYATEFVLDGFLPTGVTVIAGYWGSGKSTNLIPLMASVAHLAPEDWGFWSDLRRHIVWVTEAPEQARDTIYSLAKQEGSAPWAEFNEWFHVTPSIRTSPKKLARELKGLAADFSYELPNGFVVKPVVVLDTTTANIDLENESDNSQVGAAMSALKEALPGYPIVLVGHTPKGAKADPSTISFRGAGAWEAEANGTYFLLHDEDTDTRFLHIQKARFTPAYREIEFEHKGGSEMVPTPWGEPQSKHFMHGIPIKSDGSARKIRKEELREERKEQMEMKKLTDRQQKIVDCIRIRTARCEPTTKADLRASIGGNPNMLMEALERLIEADEVRVHSVEKKDLGLSGKAGRTGDILLLAEVDLNTFLLTIADDLLQ